MRSSPIIQKPRGPYPIRLCAKIIQICIGLQMALNMSSVMCVHIAIYCITLYFRGKKFSRTVNLKYFREKIFSRIYCSRENIFPRKYLPAKISSRENNFPRKYLLAKISSRENIFLRFLSVPQICRLVDLGYAGRNFREKLISNIFARRYFREYILFTRKYLPAKISSRENNFPRKYLLAKISSRENIFLRFFSVPQICRLVDLGYAV